MAGKIGIWSFNAPLSQNAAYVHTNLAPEETSSVYESLEIPRPTDNANNPDNRITQPPKTKVNRRLQIALMLVGIICAALVATVVWLLEHTHEEKNVNGCSNNPCAGGATCLNAHDDFYCSCPLGFTGKLCQLEVSECSSRPCKNGGTCVVMVDSYRCFCSAGYYGTNCQARDPCRSHPCQNGAACRNQSETYLCSCQSGYTGRNCETVTNHCLSLPCKNGASCVNMAASFMCSCTSGFEGPRCEDEISECSSHPCQNGGTCVDMVNSYRCLCSAGYNGTNCQDLQYHHPYRLVGININGMYGGRVEVFHNGVWGTVCDDGWDSFDAKVFCKSLNLPYSKAIGVQSAHFGPGKGTIWLNNVSCTGSESNIESCSHLGWGRHNCDHSEDAGVICL